MLRPLPLKVYRFATLITAALVVAALSQCLSYWPGIMTWDALTQYDQAVQGYFEDWHPPLMAWVWSQLIAVKAGPAPMYVLQLALYWLGYGLIIAGAFRRQQPVAAALTAACALMPFPLALMGSVLKDCLMEGLFLTGAGLLLWVRPERDWALRIAAMLFFLLGALLRFNAFLAVVPLLVGLMPAPWRNTRPKIFVATLGWLILVLISLPLTNRIIGAEKTHVALSLIIFDLGGTTRYSGIDMFPPLGLAHPVEVNSRCYRPDKWDNYASWANPPCPINFDRVEAALERGRISPYSLVVRAILAHPLAYAEHRLRHFNINSRFIVPDEVQGPVPDRDTDNEWHFSVTRGPGLKLFNTLTGLTIHSPLGWPIFWIALTGGVLTICPFLPSAKLVAPLSLSAFLYGIGYLALSVSSELRYHLWTITAGGIAAAFAAADMACGAAVPRQRLWAAIAPALAVAAVCSAARFAAFM